MPFLGVDWNYIDPFDNWLFLSHVVDQRTINMPTQHMLQTGSNKLLAARQARQTIDVRLGRQDPYVVSCRSRRSLRDDKPLEERKQKGFPRAREDRSYMVMVFVCFIIVLFVFFVQKFLSLTRQFLEGEAEYFKSHSVKELDGYVRRELTIDHNIPWEEVGCSHDAGQT